MIENIDNIKTPAVAFPAYHSQIADIFLKFAIGLCTSLMMFILYH